MPQFDSRTTHLINRRQLLVSAAALLTMSAAKASMRAKNSWVDLDTDAGNLLAARIAPGFALSVMHAGKLVYSRGFGLADIETDTAVASNTVFHIGSITKQFTGAAIALLHEDGKLGFDDKLSRFLPDFPHARDITLRQMLTHTSGLGNYTNMDSTKDFMQAARIDYDDHALIAAMRATSPLFIAKPGTVWAYSNTAFVLLGVVIEKASGIRYGEFLQQRLLKVAGLSNTAVDDAASVVPHRASGYTPDEKAAVGFDNASFISMSFPGAAGALRSTTEDLCRWHNELLWGNLLKPDSLTAMLTPGRLNDGSLPTAQMDPETHAEPKPIEYGFGLEMGSFEGRRYVGHAGGINGFSSQLRSFPAERLSVACLFNCDFMGRPEWYTKSESLRDSGARAGLKTG